MTENQQNEQNEDNNYSSAQSERWGKMTPKEREAMSQKMQDGRRKAKARRRLTSKKAKASMSNTFLLADRLSEIYVMAGGREQVIRLLDIVELVNEEG